MICVEAGNWGLRLEGLERLKGLEGLEGLERLKGLEGLEGLERLKGLEGLEGLEILRGLGKGYVTGFIVLKVLNKTLTHN